MCIPVESFWHPSCCFHKTLLRSMSHLLVSLCALWSKWFLRTGHYALTRQPHNSRMVTVRDISVDLRREKKILFCHRRCKSTVFRSSGCTPSTLWGLLTKVHIIELSIGERVPRSLSNYLKPIFAKRRYVLWGYRFGFSARWLRIGFTLLAISCVFVNISGSDHRCGASNELLK